MPDIFSREKIYGILKNRYSDLPNDWIENNDFFKQKPLTVLSYDVDSIKNYIFSSSEFKAIIGASKMVSDYDEKVKKFLSKENSYVVHAVGGTGLAVILKDDSKRIEEELRQSFKEIVPGGFLTISKVDFYPSELIHGLKKVDLNTSQLEKEFNLKFNNLTEQTDFYKLFSLLASNMREEKNSKSTEMKRITPEFDLCEACNTYPASEIIHRAADPNESNTMKVCEICKKKIDSGEEKIKKEKFADSLLDIDTEHVKENQTDWLGVIYIDGNNLGKVYSRIKTDKEYITLSENIENAAESAVKQVIKEKNLENKYAAPILGGDDIMLFIPAKQAIDIFLRLDEILSEKFGNIDGKGNGISYCGSILFCKKSMPLKMIFEASSNLLKQAKSKFYNDYKNGQTEKNYIATRVLWNNSTEVKSEEFFSPNNDIKEIMAEGMDISYFKSYLKLLKKLNSDEKKFLIKVVKLMNEISPVIKLNINYFFVKNIKNVQHEQRLKELYTYIFFPEENRTRVLSSIDLLNFIEEGEKNENKSGH
ncbi:hypothetical protein HWHPT5561_08585 [Petrotoga sp. HWH.PT.55.6.1]|jgi:hypothetical protein|uniref:Cas10/Cmr2 second palm domain-containing protein n=1 Tax=unclassified Petrotoga TaxID=2620614 RepID=UPI000CA08CDC|nr:MULTISPECIES: hypothetical protein [unclassified Petrotoga]PNR94430.1 hypothetical protein X926_00365 [Petrotoga sp. HWHPT.55.6.3]RPD35376.1 hypothetical protein HWHPT5561_08585 [Petrotoga sp. HWH.PT.55.6.1]